MRTQNDFNSYDSTDWFVYAAGEEFMHTWGSIDQFKGQVPHLQFMRAQTCWLEATIDDLQVRRRAAYAIGRGLISPTDYPDSDLRRLFSSFGVQSVSPRLADQICRCYNEPPVRVFAKKGPHAEGINKAFQQLYALADVDAKMQAAYRAAIFTNLVAIVPSWNGKLELQVLTPDYFRLEGDELWTGPHANPLRFVVYTPTEIKTVQDGRVTESIPHTYGRAPYVLLKLQPSVDTYGAGISEAAEINAWSGLIDFLGTRIAALQAFSVGVAVNFDIKDGTKIGPGHLLKGDNRSGDASGNPSFAYVSPNGRFPELEEYRSKKVRSFELNQGLPSFVVDQTGTPPTGVALQVMQQAILDKGRQHMPAIVSAERDLAELLSIMAAHKGRPMLATFNALDFGVYFRNSSTYADKSELEYDMARMDRGLASPAAIADKYFGVVPGRTDADAVKLIRKNTAFFALGTTSEEQEVEDEAGAKSMQTVEVAPSLVLNGAQVTSAKEIVIAVAQNQLPRDAGLGMLESFFNITREQAEKVMGSVGVGFEPKPEVTV